MFPRLSRLPNRSKKQLIHTNRRWVDGKNLSSLSLWDISLFTSKCMTTIYHQVFHQILIFIEIQNFEFNSITSSIFIHFSNLSSSLETSFPGFCPNISNFSSLIEFEFALNANHRVRVGSSMKLKCWNSLGFRVLSSTLKHYYLPKADNSSSETVHIWGYDLNHLLNKISLTFSIRFQ